MDDEKRVLVFSDAGGTGRSYHADLGCRNQRRRIHYLLEPGWKADAAIQGLGRSNRTNQKQPPVFRPVATDVKGEKRFLSTIARRLDTLGAITRGQRQTGGQGLFRADDNLESPYAKAALRQFYQLLYAGKIEGCSLTAFQDATGLDLVDQDGSLKEELPPITQFLNRILALRIAMQNLLFVAFEQLLDADLVVADEQRRGRVAVPLNAAMRLDSIPVGVDREGGAIVGAVAWRSLSEICRRAWAPARVEWNPAVWAGGPTKAALRWGAPHVWARAAAALPATWRQIPYVVLRLATLAPGSLRENNEP